MQSTIANLCTRCGKERIVLKTWQALVGKSQLTYTNTGCPDTECQKIIDDEATVAREKRQAIETRKIQEKEDRAKVLAAAKAA